MGSASPAGFVNLGNQGSVTANDNTSGISGGTLEYGSVYVGRGGTGLFTQSGGQYYSNGSLTLGWNAGDSGTYVLSSGTAGPAAINVGYAGTGDFQQSGGSVSANSGVTLGGNAGSNGTSRSAAQPAWRQPWPWVSTGRALSRKRGPPG